MPKDLVQRTAKEKWQDQNKQAAADKQRNQDAGQAFASSKPDPATSKKTDDLDSDDGGEDEDKSKGVRTALMDIATDESTTPAIARGRKPDPVKKVVKSLSTLMEILVSAKVKRKNK